MVRREEGEEEGCEITVTSFGFGYITSFSPIFLILQTKYQLPVAPAEYDQWPPVRRNLPSLVDIATSTYVDFIFLTLNEVLANSMLSLIG